ncbi:MAG: AI-2E family transporter [Alphaproteobacteria bacterium]|nr:AI-2E family transporter [Alphaproteobacteria bacterium]
MTKLQKGFTQTHKTALILVCILFGIGYFFYSISGILLPFILAFVFAYFLHPAVQSLEKRHLSRTFATGIVITGFVVFILSVLLIIIPILQAQVMALFAKVPLLADTLKEQIQSLVVYAKQMISPEQLADISNTVSQSVGMVLKSVANGLLNILTGGVVLFNVISMLMITPIVLFYVLRDWQGVENQMSDLIPEKNKKSVMPLLQEINTTLSGFIRGQSMVCLSLGLFYGIGLSIIGLESGLLVGLLSGILSFIPYFGFLTGVILSIFLAITTHASLPLWIGIAIVFTLGQILEGYVLTPKLVGDKVGLHPVWVIFALFAGGALLGFVGVLLAVPIAAVLAIFIRRTLSWYRTSIIYKGKK